MSIVVLSLLYTYMCIYIYIMYMCTYICYTCECIYVYILYIRIYILSWSHHLLQQSTNLLRFKT